MPDYSVNPMDFYTLTAPIDLNPVITEVLYYITFICQPNLVGDVYDAGGGKTALRFAVRVGGLDNGRSDQLLENLLNVLNLPHDGTTTMVKAVRL